MTDIVDIVGIAIATVTAVAVCAIAVTLCVKRLISNMVNKINQSVNAKVDAAYAAMEQRYDYAECDIQELDRINSEHINEINEIWRAIKDLADRIEKQNKQSSAETVPVLTSAPYDGRLSANANARSLDLEVRHV